MSRDKIDEALKVPIPMFSGLTYS
jgi:methylenetetrahydrofolate reductase (NADPH)